jgi:hypothetical protein
LSKKAQHGDLCRICNLRPRYRPSTRPGVKTWARCLDCFNELRRIKAARQRAEKQQKAERSRRWHEARNRPPGTPPPYIQRQRQEAEERREARKRELWLNPPQRRASRHNVKMLDERYKELGRGEPTFATLAPELRPKAQQIYHALMTKHAHRMAKDGRWLKGVLVAVATKLAKEPPERNIGRYIFARRAQRGKIFKQWLELVREHEEALMKDDAHTDN